MRYSKKRQHPGLHPTQTILKLFLFLSITSLMVFGAVKWVGIYDWTFIYMDEPANLKLLLFKSLIYFLLLFGCLMGLRFWVRQIKANAPLKRTLTVFFDPYVGSFTLTTILIILELITGFYVAHHEFGFMGRYYPNEAYYEQMQALSPYDQEPRERPYYQLYYDEDMGLMLHKDAAMKDFTVIDHRRKTVGQPENYERTIYIFGGSTIFNIRATDSLTIPSLLQKLLNEAAPETYKVVNMGVPGHLLNSQVTLLNSVDLNPEDIVVFYDGVNNVNGIFQKGFFLYPDEGDQLYGFTSQLSNHSLFYEYILAPYNFPPYIIRNSNRMNLALENLRTTFSSDVIKAAAICQENEIAFYHFLQPTLFTVSEKSDYENKLAHDYELIPNGWETVHSQGYQVLIDLNQELINAGIQSFDLKNALDPEFRQPGQEFFFDFAHVNHNANQILAQRIFEILWSDLQKD